MMQKTAHLQDIPSEQLASCKPFICKARIPSQLCQLCVCLLETHPLHIPADAEEQEASTLHLNNAISVITAK